ncbi:MULTISPECIES: hypothetical protein [Sphaerimonospora]|uniref:Uncharacterized protein n=1 Tax=Sphaerimonospora thailandensis TaxID=795644 RepID=A0A8J3R397_9ACTN|nr:hypothetical protein [Sphaerimonospora thailandensis]GIH68366.1 hypothetical protein Mth01_06190 [Sphaerimonospora thailandensis]
MTLILDLPLYSTDLTACGRCGETAQLEQMFRCSGRTWICLGCITEAVEAHRLAVVAGRQV